MSLDVLLTRCIAASCMKQTLVPVFQLLILCRTFINLVISLKALTELCPVLFLIFLESLMKVFLSARLYLKLRNFVIQNLILVMILKERMLHARLLLLPVNPAMILNFLILKCFLYSQKILMPLEL